MTECSCWNMILKDSVTVLTQQELDWDDEWHISTASENRTGALNKCFFSFLFSNFEKKVFFIFFLHQKYKVCKMFVWKMQPPSPSSALCFSFPRGIDFSLLLFITASSLVLGLIYWRSKMRVKLLSLPIPPHRHIFPIFPCTRMVLLMITIFDIYIIIIM